MSSPRIATVSTNVIPIMATRIISSRAAGWRFIALRALQVMSPSPMPTDIELKAIDDAITP